MQTAAIGLLPGPAAGPSGRGSGQGGLPEIAEGDVHHGAHGAAPVGAAAARAGLARYALSRHAEPMKGCDQHAA